MVVSTRLTAPNYKIFEPDSLDAIYAKGNLDPIMGGISYAFGSAHKQEAANNQSSYLESQDKFNRMAAALDAMEIDSKTKQEAMKLGIGLIKEGEDPTKILGAGNVYANPADSSLPALKRGELQASINQKNSAASASGKEGYDTVQTVTTPPGSNQTVTVTQRRKPGVLETGAGKVNPTTSTPVQSNANAGAVNAQQIQARAEAAVGRGAKIIDQSPSGHTLWQGPKGTATFKPDGTMVR
ncbi:hypothetical protein UFOVP1323_29 [uncultured Caudovirales phage]|uniref:Uncharacterized protein n=1 Tax=uncultured Caudovirales phage TaxID=2100421 RepID=A0A6J5RJ71_9CAUD|nr:hypothetical protein UFOVP1323_29 [uncultured Caudovirales phage]